MLSQRDVFDVFSSTFTRIPHDSVSCMTLIDVSQFDVSIPIAGNMTLLSSYNTEICVGTDDDIFEYVAYRAVDPCRFSKLLAVYNGSRAFAWLKERTDRSLCVSRVRLSSMHPAWKLWIVTDERLLPADVLMTQSGRRSRVAVVPDAYVHDRSAAYPVAELDDGFYHDRQSGATMLKHVDHVVIIEPRDHATFDARAMLAHARDVLLAHRRDPDLHGLALLPDLSGVVLCGSFYKTDWQLRQALSAMLVKEP